LDLTCEVRIESFVPSIEPTSLVEGTRKLRMGGWVISGLT